MDMITAKFDDPDLAAKADDMGQAELDQLPFSVLKLNGADRVIGYNSVQEESASINCSDDISYNPFTDIAPCIDNPFFRARFERGIAEGSLAIDFEVETDIGPRAERIRVRMLNARDLKTVVFSSSAYNRPVRLRPSSSSRCGDERRTTYLRHTTTI